MRRHVETILQEALTLPEEERAEIAGPLLESLGPEPEGDVEAAWRQEVAARVTALETGEVEMTPWGEIRDRFLARLSERVEFTPEALREIDDAFEWYLERSLHVAEAFVREATSAFALIASSPQIWPRFESGNKALRPPQIPLQHHLPRDLGRYRSRCGGSPETASSILCCFSPAQRLGLTGSGVRSALLPG
jgi:putative addiction module component (TIGR02574 family)